MTYSLIKTEAQHEAAISRLLALGSSADAVGLVGCGGDRDRVVVHDRGFADIQICCKSRIAQIDRVVTLRLLRNSKRTRRTGRAAGLALMLAVRRQGDRRQDGDDRHHDHQLDQGEA